MTKRSEFGDGQEIRQELSGTNSKATWLPFCSWCTCCVEGKTPEQQNVCCSSERDVPRTQVDYFFTNCNNSDCMSSDGRARLAETCELPDESPGLNLGRGKQGDAIRAPSTDLRVARLRYENAVPVELMTVSSILDYGSGCTMKRPSDKGTESLPLSIVSKRVELCIRKRFVTRNNNGRAETKEHILEKAPMHS